MLETISFFFFFLAFSLKPSCYASHCPLAEKLLPYFLQFSSFFMGRRLNFYPVTPPWPLQSSLQGYFNEKERKIFIKQRFFEVNSKKTEPGTFLMMPSDVKCLASDTIRAGVQVGNELEQHRKIVQVPAQYDFGDHRVLPHPHSTYLTLRSLLYPLFLYLKSCYIGKMLYHHK